MLLGQVVGHSCFAALLGPYENDVESVVLLDGRRILHSQGLVLSLGDLILLCLLLLQQLCSDLLPLFVHDVVVTLLTLFILLRLVLMQIVLGQLLLYLC